MVWSGEIEALETDKLAYLLQAIAKLAETADLEAKLLKLEAQRDGFPACRVVSIAHGQTLRQAAIAGGKDPDADRLIVGIPQACF